MSYRTLPKKATLKPTDFTAHASDDDLSKMKQLIELSPLGPRTYENTSQGERYFGIGYEWMQTAKERWVGGYDWRKTESRINSFPNYMVEISDDGERYGVHFVGLFSERRDAVPICLLHGWPGSFLEFLDMLDLLRSKYSASTLPYHVIIPSLPGYGYSDGAPLTKNMRMEDQARIMDKLMVGLGFGDRYVTQGGDVGSFVSRMMLVSYPGCKAAHLNFCIMAPPKTVPQSVLNAAELKGLERMQSFQASGNAYAREHATRPATIGTVLSSSPIALLAWIAEKFHTWTDQDPSMDAVLDSVTLYWLTQTFPRSIFPYRMLKDNVHSNPRWHVNSPKALGYSWFPFELGPVPKAWVETTGNLVWSRQHDSGGHFAAMERPDVLLGDIEDFVAEVWRKIGPKL